MKTQPFIRTMHRTLDNFVEYYKIAPNKEKQLSIDRRCYKFVKTITVNEAYQLGFINYYDERKAR